MKNRILNNWTLPRILRVAIGMVIIGEAIFRADLISGIAATAFTGMGVFNIGCCGSDACYTPVKTGNGELKDVQCEDVV